MSPKDKGSQKGKTYGSQFQSYRTAFFLYADCRQDQNGGQLLQYRSRSRIRCLNGHKIRKLAQADAAEGKDQQAKQIRFFL